MTFDEFNAIHHFLIEHAKGSEFEGNTFYVGGCVRDTLLGRDIKDIDICVSMPNGGIKFAEFITKKLNIYEEGKNPVVFPQFGTAKFRLGNAFPKFGSVEIETVQSRKEAYRDTESRKPETCFGTLKEDSLRRDLTINAIYCRMADGKVFDPSSFGEEDMNKHLLRTPTDPDVSFKDDALRILRVIRFASTLGWGIEHHTWLGMCKNAYRITTISKERIRDEFNKIITSEHPAEGIRRLYWCGVLDYIITPFEGLHGLEQGSYHIEDAFEHSLTVMKKMSPKVENRLAGLFHDIAKKETKCQILSKIHFPGHEKKGSAMAEEIMTELKYPKSTIEAVKSAIENHMRFKQSSIPSNHSLRKFVNEVVDMDLCLELIEADNTSHAPKHCKKGQVAKIRKRIESLGEKEENMKVHLPINGKDIMEIFNIRKGPKVGAALRILVEYFYINPKMTKDEAVAVIKHAIAKNEL